MRYVLIAIRWLHTKHHRILEKSIFENPGDSIPFLALTVRTNLEFMQEHSAR